MSERQDERESHPSHYPEKAILAGLEKRTFSDRSAAEAALEVVGAGKWREAHVKRAAMERRKLTADTARHYGRRLFKDFKQNFYDPLSSSAERLFAEDSLFEAAFSWYGMTWNLDAAMDSLSQRYGDIEIVPYIKWYSDAVYPRVLKHVQPEAARESLLQYAQEPGSTAENYSGVAMPIASVWMHWRRCWPTP